ncbi:hypothetical protein FA15DRAFT_555318, partial [Coprinopsis marcescibilis]
LAQMGMGHIALEEYLHRIGKVPSPLCQGWQTEAETATHFLFQCPKYRAEREELRGMLLRGGNVLHTLLMKEAVWPALFRFINATQQF